MVVLWPLIVVLICISLLSGDVDHLFICLFDIRTSSLMQCLFKFFAYFGGASLFSYYWVLGGFYSRYKIFITYTIWKYFSQSAACLFILLTRPYKDQTFQILVKSKFSIFSFLDNAFGVISKTSLPDSRLQRFSLMFLSRNFTVLHLGQWNILS